MTTAVPVSVKCQAVISGEIHFMRPGWPTVSQSWTIAATAGLSEMPQDILEAGELRANVIDVTDGTVVAEMPYEMPFETASEQLRRHGWDIASSMVTGSNPTTGHPGI